MNKTAKREKAINLRVLVDAFKHSQLLNFVDILIKSTLLGYYMRLSQRPVFCAHLSGAKCAQMQSAITATNGDYYRDM
jgi:hypothetical protein